MALVGVSVRGGVGQERVLVSEEIECWPEREVLAQEALKLKTDAHTNATGFQAISFTQVDLTISEMRKRSPHRSQSTVKVERSVGQQALRHAPYCPPMSRGNHRALCEAHKKMPGRPLSSF